MVIKSKTDFSHPIDKIVNIVKEQKKWVEIQMYSENSTISFVSSELSGQELQLGGDY